MQSKSAVVHVHGVKKERIIRIAYFNRNHFFTYKEVEFEQQFLLLTTIK